MENIPQFKEFCSYCFSNTETTITVCCGVSLCKNHINLHNGHIPMYTVQKNGNDVFIESEVLNEEEKEDLKLFIRSSQYKDNEYIKKTNCPHKEDIRPQPMENGISEIVCDFTNCGLQNNLYICLSCGYKGCAKVQYGIEGNGHASDHNKETGHHINTQCKCLQFDGGNLSYCYICDDFINFDNIRKCMSELNIDYVHLISLKNGGKEVATPNEKDEEEEINTDQRVLGIYNSGNTCYISVILHLLSLNDKSLEEHFFVCQKAPLECFVCQFIKVLNALMHKMEYKEHSIQQNSINILDLIERIEDEFPMFQRPYQQDPNEFMMYTFMKLKEYELVGEIPCFVDDYLIKISSKMTCKDCSLNATSICELFSLTLEFDNSLSNALEHYLNDKFSKCSCGGNISEQNKIVGLSNFLVLVINRSYKTEDDNYGKNKNEFHADDELCIGDGFIYKKMCTIIHRGDTLVTGHYVVEIDGCVIDDEKVAEKENEDGQGYIFLYKKIY